MEVSVSLFLLFLACEVRPTAVRSPAPGPAPTGDTGTVALPPTDTAPPGDTGTTVPELPECDCFVEVSWCGAGAGEVAAELGCRIPLLPEHDGDLLYCPDGEWGVLEVCDEGCVSAPTGTPDSCVALHDYLLPIRCPEVASCTNGNNTSSHTGTDVYAYDFGMPIGTPVVAMRAGTVLQVRNVSVPGDPCHDGGGSECANEANTVEVLHTDGTVGLYMHLDEGTATTGAWVEQGEVLGASGTSGWSTGPHLHVQVQEDCGSWWCQSMPFEFGEGGPISAGSALASQNCAP